MILSMIRFKIIFFICKIAKCTHIWQCGGNLDLYLHFVCLTLGNKLTQKSVSQNNQEHIPYCFVIICLPPRHEANEIFAVIYRYAYQRKKQNFHPDWVGGKFSSKLEWKGEVQEGWLQPSMECISGENAQTRERASTSCKLYRQIWPKNVLMPTFIDQQMLSFWSLSSLVLNFSKES